MDYRASLKLINDDDWVYVDPPYTVNHNANGFRRYNERLFSWKDQEFLGRWATSFAANGGRVVVSNAMHPEVLDLYPSSAFTALRVARVSNMAADNEYRGVRQELVLVSKSVISNGSQVRKTLQRGLRYPVDNVTGRKF
jgi:DNA adenine methylase